VTDKQQQTEKKRAQGSTASRQVVRGRGNVGAQSPESGAATAIVEKEKTKGDHGAEHAC